MRIDSIWFLEITPTYFFTKDGFTRDKYDQDHLSGIKRLEKNSAVLGQLIMWAEYLGSSPQRNLLVKQYPFLVFDKLEEFEIDVGINDSLWLGNEDAEHSTLPKDSLDDLPLFQLSQDEN